MGFLAIALRLFLHPTTLCYHSQIKRFIHKAYFPPKCSGVRNISLPLFLYLLWSGIHLYHIEILARYFYKKCSILFELLWLLSSSFFLRNKFQLRHSYQIHLNRMWGYSMYFPHISSILSTHLWDISSQCHKLKYLNLARYYPYTLLVSVLMPLCYSDCLRIQI